jgi:hypothetical protein
MSIPTQQQLRGLPRDKANDAGARRPPLVEGSLNVAGPPRAAPADHAGRWQERAGTGPSAAAQRLHSGRWEARGVDDNKREPRAPLHAGRWQAQAHAQYRHGKPKLSTHLHEGRWEAQGNLRGNFGEAGPDTALVRALEQLPRAEELSQRPTTSQRQRNHSGRGQATAADEIISPVDLHGRCEPTLPATTARVSCVGRGFLFVTGAVSTQRPAG